MNVVSKNRIGYFDSLKFYALLIIYTTHFIASFNGAAFQLWNVFPFSLFLTGISGKFGVSLLSVMLGYFAYIKGVNSKNSNVFSYCTKRFFYFFISGFFINSIYFILGKLNITDCICTFKDVLWASLTISDSIFPTFWCMRAFYFASVISYIAGYNHFSISELVVLIILFLFLHQLWIAICLLGTLIFYFLKTSIIRKTATQILLFVFVFIAIKRAESNITYFIDGICSICIILLISANPSIQHFFNISITSNIGSTSMAIFIIHPLTYAILGSFLFDFFQISNWKIEFIIVWIICFFVICIIAKPVNDLLSLLSNRFSKFIDKIECELPRIHI